MELLEKHFKALTWLMASLFALFAAGCGGGGGGGGFSGPVISTLSFPLQTGYKKLIANGMNKTFTVSGTCTGSGTATAAPATTAAVFEGVNGFSATNTLTMSLTGCIPASIADSSTEYFDSNYIPLGFDDIGVDYGVWLTAPLIPSSVKVGDTGNIGTETLYTDSTKAVGDGRQDLGYVVESDTVNTAIINLITKIYDASGVLIGTEQDKYRIDSVGTLTPISFDIQLTNGSSTHFVLKF